VNNNEHRAEVIQWCSHMKIICIEIIEAYKAILECEKHGVLVDEHTRFVLFRTIGSYITIRVCAFLEEYNYQFIFDDDEEMKSTVHSFKTMCQPIVDSVGEWEDLRKYRNHILAHSYREKKRDKSLSSVLATLSKYDVPKNIHDLHYLCECMNIVDALFDGFEKVFGKEFYLRDIDQKLQDLPSRINGVNRDQKIKSLRENVNAEILKLKNGDGLN
jgi:hypothetical protein